MNTLTRKIGPLPAYVWAGIAVAAVLLIVELRRRSAANATTTAVADTVAAEDTSGNATDASQVPGSEYANTGGDWTGSGAYGPGDPTYEGAPATAGPAITTSDFLKLEHDTEALTAAENRDIAADRADTLADRKSPAKPHPKPRPKKSAHELHMEHVAHERRVHHK